MDLIAFHKNNPRLINFRHNVANLNYIETDQEREKGHVDTRAANFNREKPDENLGCDMEIDVAG